MKRLMPFPMVILILVLPACAGRPTQEQYALHTQVALQATELAELREALEEERTAEPTVTPTEELIEPTASATEKVMEPTPTQRPPTATPVQPTPTPMPMVHKDVLVLAGEPAEEQYARWLNVMWQDGVSYDVINFNEQPIESVAARLEAYRVVAVLWNGENQSRYLSTEDWINILDYVHKGGSLYLNAMVSTSELAHTNDLFRELGVSVNDDYGVHEVTFGSHPINSGVTTISLGFDSIASISGEPVSWAKGKDPQNFALLVALQHGQGKVACTAVTLSRWFDESIDEYDHRRLWENIYQWLVD